MIETEAGHLLRLVDQIALALKVDARTLEYRRTRQRLAPLVQRAVEDVDTARHELTVRTDDRRHGHRRWALVQRSDPSGSRQRGPLLAGRLRDPIELREGDGRAVVEIEDRGPGVPAEQRDAVFERFARWRPKGYEDRAGSGLGLFICRAIVGEQGGDASLDAGPNGGTILRVRLPSEEPDEETG